MCYLLLGVNLRCYLHRSTSLIFYGIWVLFMLIWFLRMVEPVIILLPFNLVVAIGWQTISYMVYRCLQQKKKIFGPYCWFNFHSSERSMFGTIFFFYFLLGSRSMTRFQAYLHSIVFLKLSFGVEHNIWFNLSVRSPFVCHWHPLQISQQWCRHLSLGLGLLPSSLAVEGFPWACGLQFI